MAKCPNCNRNIPYSEYHPRGLRKLRCNGCGVELMPTFTSLGILGTLIVFLCLLVSEFLLKLGLDTYDKHNEWFFMLLAIPTGLLLFHLWWEKIVRLELLEKKGFKLSNVVFALFILGIFGFGWFILVELFSKIR